MFFPYTIEHLPLSRISKNTFLVPPEFFIFLEFTYRDSETFVYRKKNTNTKAKSRNQKMTFPTSFFFRSCSIPVFIHIGAYLTFSVHYTFGKVAYTFGSPKCIAKNRIKKMTFPVFYFVLVCFIIFFTHTDTPSTFQNVEKHSFWVRQECFIFFKSLSIEFEKTIQRRKIETSK
jgi:hypothetical protein